MIIYRSPGPRELELESPRARATVTCTVTGKLDRDSGNDVDGMIEPLIAAMIAAAWLPAAIIRSRKLYLPS